MDVGFAFLSEGKIHLKVGGLPVRTFESSFARDLRERTLRLQQRSAWKTHGSGAQFMSGSLLWGAQDREPEPMRIAITGLSRGIAPGELVYALQTNEISGVFALKDSGLTEQRLFHGSDCRIASPCANFQQDLIVCSVVHSNGLA